MTTIQVNFNGRVHVDNANLPEELITLFIEAKLLELMQQLKGQPLCQDGPLIREVEGSGWTNTGDVAVGELRFRVHHDVENDESAVHMSLRDACGGSSQADVRVYVHPKRVLVKAIVPGTDREEHIALVQLHKDEVATSSWGAVGGQPISEVKIRGFVGLKH